MPRAMGPQQSVCLHLLRTRGDWFPGCGWGGQVSATRRVLDSLVVRGDAEKVTDWAGRDVYRAIADEVAS